MAGGGVRRRTFVPRAKQRGLGLIGKLLLIPAGLVVTLILIIGFFEGRKVYWDYQVREMCARDGGRKIQAAVTVNEKEYALLLNKFDQLSPPLESKAGRDVAIVHRFTSTYIHRSNPEVRRDELAVIRRSDSKVLGLEITYSRVGGDFLAFHPSVFSCPNDPVDFFSAVIRKQIK